MFCELCLVVPEDGNFKCPNCQSLQPYGLPSVCLIIEHFLEERFSDLYAERKEALLKQTSGQYGSLFLSISLSSFDMVSLIKFYNLWLNLMLIRK